MSPLSTQQPNPFRKRVSSLFLIVTLVVGCASQSRESGKAADSVASPAAPAAVAPIAPENSLQPSGAASKDGTKGELQSAEVQRSASPNLPVQAAPAPASIERKRSEGAKSATSGAGLAGPKASPGRNAAAKPALDDSEAQPAFAEPPELTQALAEFDAQWEALSTTRACDDACRALESMRRSAQRICDLVLDGDPRARCQSARTKLEQASKDLSTRCTTCR